MNAEFFVIDENGCQLSDEICGCLNAFSTYKQALAVCIKVSKKNEGKFTVSVCVPSTQFENGVEVDCL